MVIYNLKSVYKIGRCTVMKGFRPDLTAILDMEFLSSNQSKFSCNVTSKGNGTTTTTTIYRIDTFKRLNVKEDQVEERLTIY